MPKDKTKVIPKFLDQLREGETPRCAAIAAGSGLTTLREWKADDPEFAKQWEDAYDEGTDVLVKEAQRRAIHGYEEVTITTSDGPKGSSESKTVTTKYSDTLLNITLQARRPGEFGKSRVELTGKDGGPIQAMMEVEFVEAPAKQVKPK